MKTLDGTEITKSLRIKAVQSLPALERELEGRAEACRERKLTKAAEKAAKKAEKGCTTWSTQPGSDVLVEDVDENEEEDEDDPNEMTENTPETRVKVSINRIIFYSDLVILCVLYDLDLQGTCSPEEGKRR